MEWIPTTAPYKACHCQIPNRIYIESLGACKVTWNSLARDKWVIDILIEEELYGKVILPHLKENVNDVKVIVTQVGMLGPIVSSYVTLK
jgi:hypothetical protein